MTQSLEYQDGMPQTMETDIMPNVKVNFNLTVGNTAVERSGHFGGFNRNSNRFSSDMQDSMQNS